MAKLFVVTSFFTCVYATSVEWNNPLVNEHMYNFRKGDKARYDVLENRENKPFEYYDTVDVLDTIPDDPKSVLVILPKHNTDKERNEYKQRIPTEDIVPLICKAGLRSFSKNNNPIYVGKICGNWLTSKNIFQCEGISEQLTVTLGGRAVPSKSYQGKDFGEVTVRAINDDNGDVVVEDSMGNQITDSDGNPLKKEDLTALGQCYGTVCKDHTREICTKLSKGDSVRFRKNDIRESDQMTVLDINDTGIVTLAGPGNMKHHIPKSDLTNKTVCQACFFSRPLDVLPLFAVDEHVIVTHKDHVYYRTWNDPKKQRPLKPNGRVTEVKNDAVLVKLDDGDHEDEEIWFKESELERELCEYDVPRQKYHNYWI